MVAIGMALNMATVNSGAVNGQLLMLHPSIPTWVQSGLLARVGSASPPYFLPSLSPSISRYIALYSSTHSLTQESAGPYLE